MPSDTAGEPVLDAMEDVRKCRDAGSRTVSTNSWNRVSMVGRTSRPEVGSGGDSRLFRARRKAMALPRVRTGLYHLRSSGGAAVASFRHVPVPNDPACTNPAHRLPRTW